MIDNDDDCLVTHSSTIRHGTMELSTMREIYKFAIGALREMSSQLRALNSSSAERMEIS